MKTKKYFHWNSTIRIKPNSRSLIRKRIKRKKGLKWRETPLRKKSTPTGELALFFEIWAEREHVCTCCKKHLGEVPYVYFFSHILPKSIYPGLSLSKKNIVLQRFDCHEIHGGYNFKK